ncbi:CEP57 isoform 16 [Pan troglodytes]|uniref:Centrosomal protein 57 n=2 Tax=Homininae TaxID=207598 RepID=F5GZ93_HUMAN|nr:centrosomal protein 57 [Homo sapiens]KAI4073724.1 centrosomal protein 57 [Homo sapiens]PNI41121.1 CEP57 isoform 16 [Pan troglodytes]
MAAASVSAASGSHLSTRGWALDYSSVVGHGICTVTQPVSFSRKKREKIVQQI